MLFSLLEGLSLVDSTGRLILATTLATLVLAILASAYARARYAAMAADLERGAASRRFSDELLQRIVTEATASVARHGRDANLQAIIENRFASDLRTLLLAERFVRAATGLVIILGLTGTFYGLTASIGRLVHLVAGDGAAAIDVTHGVTEGLTHALSGMAVAFSNSLLGIVSAVILTLLSVVASPTDRRLELMVRLETHLEGLVAPSARPAGLETVAGFDAAVGRLEGAVARFEGALEAFAASTRDFHEFNAHLKDNVQRMSLSFADLSDALKAQAASLKPPNGRP